jgi:fumarylpyruvate hydrolase
MSEELYVFPPPDCPTVPVAGERLLFPVHRVYCVGQNYREHAVEMGASGREAPFFFAKPADAVCCERVVPYPPVTENLHHEVELVVALDGGGRDVAAEDALDCVYGYAIGVDLTRRDLQAAARKAGRPWTTAKGFDRSAPISAIFPLARCGHPHSAAIRLSVNGETRQSGNTAQMIWKVPELLAELSRYFELRSGDLVFTGTPAGVGPLLPGDRVACSIDGLDDLAFELGDAPRR